VGRLAAELPNAARIVELAPGKAELLCRLLLALPGASAVGIDRSPWFLAEARTRAAELGVRDRLELRVADATSVDWPDGSADLAISMGAAGILGDHAATLVALAGMVRPTGGLVLFGDGVWTAEPPAEGLASFGMARDELPDGLQGQAELGRRAGLEAEWAETTALEEWDDYETAYADGITAWAAANPDDPEREAFLERSSSMRRSYDEWRRGAFGFGITCFRRGAGS
jgi:hypothetical protein